MKKCDKSDKCIWGNREHPGYCSYDLGLKDKTLCPKETDDFENDDEGYDQVYCADCGRKVNIDDTFGGLCPDCQSIAIKEFRHYFYKLSRPQREFLNAYFDGNELI